MPGSSTIPIGNARSIFILQAALTPAAVNTITAPEQTFTVNGLLVNDLVFVQKPTAQAGLAVASARVTAANTLGITYVNPTVGNITPTAETYLIFVVRPENAAPFPTAIV
jgi:PPE-repeat protein